MREAFELYAAGVTGAALLQRARDLGLRTKHGHTVSLSRLYEMLRQPVYAGIVRNVKWGKDRRGDFEALVSEMTFARVQARLNRPASTEVMSRNEPDRDRTADRTGDDAFPLRRFARCGVCGPGLTGSASRSRNGSRYFFYHCTRGCVRVAQTAFEQTFVELLDRLRPHPAYWKLLRADVLDAWRADTDNARTVSALARRQLTDLEQKLARLDDTFIYQRAIDEGTYRAQRDQVREAIALATMAAADATSEAMDVESMLAFAEHTMTHASALWTSETCTSRRVALQWALFPAGLTLREDSKIEPPVTCLEFFELTPRSLEENGVVKGLVDLTGIEPVTS